jgi:Kef-type K+ transport system membrane component KefB
VAGEVQLIILLFITFLLAKALGELMERLKQPALVGEIAAGILIANLVFGGFSFVDVLQLNEATPEGKANMEFIEALAHLGVIFLIFAVGLEIRASELRKVGGLAAYVAVLGVVIPFLLGFLYIMLAEGTSHVVEAMFIGAALVATSVGITARVLREKNLLKSREAMVILGAAVIDDILGIMVLTIAIGVAGSSQAGGSNLLFQIIAVAGLSTFFVLLFIFLGPRLVRRFAHPESPKQVLDRLRTHNAPFVVALLFCLGVSALATFFQLAAIIGAFLAGMAMAEVRDKYHLEHSFEPINALFVPFFFLFIGLKVHLSDLFAVWQIATIITVLAVVGKLVGCWFAAMRMGRRSALVVGMGMVPRGEVGIIVALAGLTAGAISEGLYSAVVVMSIATSIFAPAFLTKLLSKPDVEAAGKTDGITPGPVDASHPKPVPRQEASPGSES